MSEAEKIHGKPEIYCHALKQRRLRINGVMSKDIEANLKKITTAGSVAQWQSMNLARARP